MVAADHKAASEFFEKVGLGSKLSVFIQPMGEEPKAIQEQMRLVAMIAFSPVLPFICSMFNIFPAGGDRHQYTSTQ